MSLASRTVKRLHLELGGKNPVIILDDADVTAAANQMAARQFSIPGQICACPGRGYVAEKVYDEFVEKFEPATSKLVVGDPMDEKTGWIAGQRRTPRPRGRLHQIRSG